MVRHNWSLSSAVIDFSPWYTDPDCNGLGYTLEGKITSTVETNGPIVYMLLDGTEIDPEEGPCFAITGSNVKIMTESPLGAVCYPGSPGITVADGAENIIIEGLEIDGGGSAVGHGIEFLGGVTDVIIRDTFIHGMAAAEGEGGDGVHFKEQPANYVEIKGNLFMGNTGFGVNAPADLNVTYNAWGAYDGPTAADLPAAITSFSPWTHVDVFVEYVEDSTRYDDEVALDDETIKYEVKANLQNALGAVFTLKFNKNYLQVQSVTNGSVFNWPGSPDLNPVTFDNDAGTITFHAASITQKSGKAQLLYTVVFKPVTTTPAAPLNPLEFAGQQGVSLFTMNPGYYSSLNIYPTALVGITDVNVYDLPTLTATPLDEYYVNNPKEFTLTVTNPDDGRDYDSAEVCLDLSNLPEGTVLEIHDGTNWAVIDLESLVDGIYCIYIGELNAGDVKEFELRITFPEAGSIGIPVKLYDDDIFLVEETFEFEVLAYTWTGSVQMQGRTVRSGVLVKLVHQALEYVYQMFSTAPITNNFGFSNVAYGVHELTITHDRYLDLIDYELTIDANTLNWGRFELKGGDVNNDNEVDLGDASIVGSYYGQAGFKIGDANFDNIVNIFDLAMVGGNYGLQSHTPGGTDYAYPNVPTWAP